MDALAAHLNELGVQNPIQPEAPPRNNRNNIKSQSVSNNNITSNPSSVLVAASSGTGNNQQSNSLDQMVDSDTDSEPDDNGRGVRNDGTLLASDPPKPL